MTKPRSFKSKQISLQLYEFSTSIYNYIRLNTLYRIMGEEDTPESAFYRIALQVNKKNKIFLMTMKNLEGVDMEMYCIKTDEEGKIKKIVKIVPETLKI